MNEQVGYIAQWDLHRTWGDPLPTGFVALAAGSQRRVYLHTPTATVYKIGDDDANRREAQVLTGLHDTGVDFAPTCTLHTVELTDYTSAHLGIITNLNITVVVMPYLPHDNSIDRNLVNPAAYAAAADLNPDNIHANNGHLWLIDAGGL